MSSDGVQKRSAFFVAPKRAVANDRDAGVEPQLDRSGNIFDTHETRRTFEQRDDSRQSERFVAVSLHGRHE
jgi:hypothetical protein